VALYQEAAQAAHYETAHFFKSLQFSNFFERRSQKKNSNFKLPSFFFFFAPLSALHFSLMRWGPGIGVHVVSIVLFTSASLFYHFEI
jgi:hypothetical protein